MRWEDERYVRLYTRDSVEWAMLSFEAQGVMCLLLRKVDRAGILQLGRFGKRGVAAALGHPTRADVIVAAVDELITDGAVKLTDDGRQLVIPNFLAAQEAKASDKARQQKARELARDLAAASSTSSTPPPAPIPDVSRGVSAPSHGVTNGHAASESVTAGHTTSQAVTPSRAVPSRAEPSVPSRAVPEHRGAAVVAEVGGLRDRLDAVWLAIRGVAYEWRSKDEDALRALMAKDDAEILRRWRIALETSFPRCTGIADLVKHWNSYGTAPPAPSSRKGPVSADQDWSNEKTGFVKL